LLPVLFRDRELTFNDNRTVVYQGDRVGPGFVACRVPLPIRQALRLTVASTVVTVVFDTLRFRRCRGIGDAVRACQLSVCNRGPVYADELGGPPVCEASVTSQLPKKGLIGRQVVVVLVPHLLMYGRP